MKVLVTGGAGYVGTILIPQLLRKGYKVRVLDNLLFGGDQLLPFVRNPNFEFQKGDIRNLQAVKTAVKSMDAVIHLAALVGYSVCRSHPKLAKETNIDGTRNIIKATHKQQLIVFASTGSNYGKVDGVCTEETPLNPLSIYGKTKTLAEKMLLERSTTIAYRYATAFGSSPRLRLDLMINDFTYKAFTQQYLVVYEKHFKRTFIHVSDMGRSLVFALENQNAMKGEVYNVGSDDMNYSKVEVCEIIKKNIPVYVHYAEVGEDADKRDYVVSYKKINQLGFKTAIEVEVGIKELIRTFPMLDTKAPYTNINI